MDLAIAQARLLLLGSSTSAACASQVAGMIRVATITQILQFFYGAILFTEKLQKTLNCKPLHLLIRPNTGRPTNVEGVLPNLNAKHVATEGALRTECTQSKPKAARANQEALAKQNNHFPAKNKTPLDHH